MRCILASHTEQFIQERRFLKGVSPATEEWYKYSFKAFAPVLSEPHQSTTALKGAGVARIERLKEPIELTWRKEEEKVLATFGPEQVQRMVH
jgi:hypothetical protein